MTDKALVCAIDVGTGGTRTAIFDAVTGNMLAQSYREYASMFPRPAWVEQRAEDWWETALQLSPVLLRAKPNSAHIMLAKLEQMGRLQWVVTQNIDALHQRAGSKLVLEVHGSMLSATCTLCQLKVDRSDLERALRKRQIPPTCPACGGILKVDAVFFGESLPREIFGLALRAARDCQLMLVVGSSLTVYPVDTLPSIAKERGASVVIINEEPTPLDDMADVAIRGEAGETLTRVVKIVEKNAR